MTKFQCLNNKSKDIENLMKIVKFKIEITDCGSESAMTKKTHLTRHCGFSPQSGMK